MSGLDPLAALFMAVSMGSVTALAAYCFWRVLTAPPSDPDDAPDDPTGGTPPGDRPAGNEPTGQA